MSRLLLDLRWTAPLIVAVAFPYAELGAVEERELAAFKAAEQYVQGMLTACGDGSFVRQGESIWEFRGVVQARGCRGIPTRSPGDGAVRWQCAVQFQGDRERVYTAAGGWSGWGRQPPLLIDVVWPIDPSAGAPTGLAKVSCADLPKRSEPPAPTPPAPAAQPPRTTGGQRATVNSPGDGFLALRSEPSVRSGSRLARIPHKTVIELSGCTPDPAGGNWCRTRYGGQSGWVLDLYVVR
jgi:hypothetical protein